MKHLHSYFQGQMSWKLLSGIDWQQCFNIIYLDPGFSVLLVPPTNQQRRDYHKYEAPLIKTKFVKLLSLYSWVISQHQAKKSNGDHIEDYEFPAHHTDHYKATGPLTWKKTTQTDVELNPPNPCFSNVLNIVQPERGRTAQIYITQTWPLIWSQKQRNVKVQSMEIHSTQENTFILG